MTNLKNLALCFCISLTLSAAAFSVNGQRRTASPNLVGTAWRIAPIEIPGTQGVIATYFLKFSENGNVGRVTILNRRPGLWFNPLTNNLDMTTGINAIVGHAGKYKQSGSSVDLEFPEQSQAGEVENDQMWGTIDVTSGQKLKFAGTKIRSDAAAWLEIGATKLIGKWDGNFADTPCVLTIDRVEGGVFYGVLTQKGGQIALMGTLNTNTQEISLTETRVISLGMMPNWTLGRNEGFLSNNGQAMFGAGVAGLDQVYNWNFSKR
jgi:hypothetical protein